MKRFTIKKRRSVRRVRGGEGSAADYGVKVWGHDQVADPNKGNVIKANIVTGGAVPFMNSPPTMGESISAGNMSQQAIAIQNESIKNMVTPQITDIQSQSVSQRTTGGRRKTKRRMSKRKYGHKIRNGRRTKTIY